MPLYHVPMKKAATSDTTHSLTENRAGEWQLCSEHGHGITKPLTTIHAVHPDTAMTRAEIWLRTHHPHTARIGSRWGKSTGYSRRWVLRRSR